MPRSELLVAALSLVLVLAPGRAVTATEFKAAANVMSSTNVFEFAVELEEAGEFSRAATEFHRYISYSKRHPDQAYPELEQVMFRHAMALSRSREYDSALKAFASFGERFPDSELIPAAMLRLGEIYEAAGVTDEALVRYEQLVRFAPGSRYAATARARTVARDVEAGRGERARERLEDADAQFSPEQVQSLMDGIDEADELPTRNPRLAGFMSALLPGSGHLYAGRPKDGLVAFVSNALLIAGTVQAFEEDMPALGAAVGLIELGWYSGTIFSSMNVAERFNQDQRRRHAERMIQSVQPGRGDGGLGLMFQHRF